MKIVLTVYQIGFLFLIFSYIICSHLNVVEFVGKVLCRWKLISVFFYSNEFIRILYTQGVWFAIWIGICVVWECWRLAWSCRVVLGNSCGELIVHQLPSWLLKNLWPQFWQRWDSQQVTHPLGHSQVLSVSGDSCFLQSCWKSSMKALYFIYFQHFAISGIKLYHQIDYMSQLNLLVFYKMMLIQVWYYLKTWWMWKHCINFKVLVFGICQQMNSWNFFVVIVLFISVR